MQARAVGDDFDLNVLALHLVRLDDVRGVVQREIHHRRIVLIDLDGDPVRFGVGRSAHCDAERQNRDCRNCTEQQLHLLSPRSVFVGCKLPSRSSAVIRGTRS